MSLATAAVGFAASFLFIFLKAWQQQNVQHRQMWWIVPTSMSMAVCEVGVMAQVVTNGWGWVVLPIGLGGGLGCLLSVYLHKFTRKQ